MIGIAQIPPEMEEVPGEFQYKSQFFFPGIAVNFLGKFLDVLERQFLRGNLLDDLFDLLELVLRDKGLAKLLQVQGRAIIRSDGPDFIAGKNVVEDFVNFQTVEQLREQARAPRRFGFARGTCVE